MSAAREGDRGAFGGLYDRHARMVHGILLARVPRRDVDDLVQDVFLAALRRLDSLRDPEAFGPWLAMIARTRAMDYHRRSQAAASCPTTCLEGCIRKGRRWPCSPRSAACPRPTASR